MARADEVKVSYIAEIADLRKKLKDIPGLTAAEAKAATAALTRQVKDTNKLQEQAAKEAKKRAKESGAAWRQAFTAATVIAVGAMLTGLTDRFTDATQAVIDYRNELNDAANRTGMTAATMQALKLAAEGSGQGFGEVVKVAERIPKLMADAEAGLETAKRGFRNLGVELHRADGALKSTDDVLHEVVQRLGEIRDPSERAIRAMDLFGKAGGKALQALAAGGDSFAIYEEIAARFGTDTGPKASEQAALMQQELARMGLVARGAGDDLWQAFGGDDGALGGLKAMTAGIVFVTDAIVEMRKNVDLGWKAWAGPLSVWTGVKNIGVAAEAITHASDAAVEYLALADQSDRITQSQSAAMAALTQEIEGNTAARERAAEITWRPLADVLKEEAQAREAVARIADQAASDTLTAEDRIVQAYNDQLIALGELETAHLELRDEIASAATEAEARMQRDLTAVYQEEQAKRTAAAAAAAAERLAIEHQTADAKLAIASSSADFAMQIADLVQRDEAEGSKRGVALAKTAGIAGVAIDAAGAVMGAWDAYGDIPFVGPILAAAQTAVIAGIAGAQTAQIASAYTGLDTGYAASTGTRLPLEVHPGERVRVETRSEVERGQGGGPIMIENIWDGSVVDHQVARRLRRGGATSAEIARRTGRVGRSLDHRST